MKGEMIMIHVLIISEHKESMHDIKAFLHTEDTITITMCKYVVKARRLAVENVYDMIIINYPLVEEDYTLPLDFAEQSDASILLMCAANQYDRIAERMENAGIYVVAKPISQQVLLQIIHFMNITQKRIQKMKSNSVNLSKKLQDIKFIDRAKCLLIEKENLTELQAHKLLEQQAMSLQITRVQLAKKIIKKYDTTERR